MLSKIRSRLRKLDPQEDAEHLNLIRASGLFDEAWYLANNPDVAQAGVDPLLHYLQFGGLEGRDPGPNFSSGWYLGAYEDVKRAGVNPLVHYLTYGKQEGRAPTRPQTVQRPDIEAAPPDDLSNDLKLIRASGFYDEAWYLTNNPDVEQARIDPLLHYLDNGGFEGRDPGPNFDSTAYWKNYKAAKSTGLNPLLHYVKYGQKEGYSAPPPVIKENKIFGVGFSKTGTTSLERALQLVGRNVCKGHWKSTHTFYLLALYVHQDYDELFRMVNYWDAFADGPWGGGDLYVRLYERFPESKFILTLRDAEGWYASFEKLFTVFDSHLDTAMDTYHAKGMYGSAYFFKHVFGIETLAGNKQKIIDCYNAYNDNVLKFFSKAHADFITFDITAGDGWEKLCSFLEEEIPDQPFPHLNKSIDQPPSFA